MAVTSPAGLVFGERMRDLRQKGGLTQVEVSARSGLPQARISELERGARMPNLLTMIPIAVALECKFADLATAFDKKGLASLLVE